jgi:hypothetical protein
MLQIQVHIQIPKPAAGVEYSKALMDEIAETWLKGGRLPKQIRVTALEWRSDSKGQWKEVRDPANMQRVRKDFSAITTAGFMFTGVQALG